MMSVEQSVEWELVGETEVLAENLFQFSLRPPRIPYDPDLRSNPGHRGGKPVTDRLSYGTALGLWFLSPFGCDSTRAYLHSSTTQLLTDSNMEVSREVMRPSTSS
jgi:hypothetical protein